MKLVGQRGVLLVIAVSAIFPFAAWAVAPNSSCRAGITTGVPTLSSATRQNPCPERNTSDYRAQSSQVVSASDLQAQINDLKLAPQQIEALVLSAKTNAEHTRLAVYYGARAASDLAQAMHHEQIALKYGASPVGSSSKFASGTVDHCMAIARQFKLHAARMRKLQQEQEQLARNAGE